jgi:sugar phosphate isomerase/epimerase
MIGIVQGRLSLAPKNRLQHFPKKYEQEFELAKKVNFDYIEFFSERQFNPKNPIWSKFKVNDYKQLSKKHNLKIYTFCDDYIIENSIIRKSTLKYLFKLIKNLNFLGIKKLILPLYEKSKINEENFFKTCNSLKLIYLYCKKKKIKLLIEANITPELFYKIKKNTSMNIFLVYDTGNRVNLKSNMYEDIEKFGSEIGHIHIKDKNNFDKNVFLGSGNVDFKLLFKKLKKIKYKYSYTIESTREKNPVKSAIKNFNFLKKFIR